MSDIYIEVVGLSPRGKGAAGKLRDIRISALYPDFQHISGGLYRVIIYEAVELIRELPRYSSYNARTLTRSIHSS